MFSLSLSTFSNSPFWILYPYGHHAADAGTFLKDNILLQVKLDALGKKPYHHPPHQTNRHEQVSALSEATHDCVVCNFLKCAFTLLTQQFKGKNCVRSGYLVDTSHRLVQCTAKEHENCDIVFNERPFHLCIVYL